jgi:glutamine amidotransferase PdxT
MLKGGVARMSDPELTDDARVHEYFLRLIDQD